MESRIAKAIETKHPPIALLWADEKPEGAMQFQEGKWGCVMWLAASAAKGRPAACDAATFGCIGGGVGMGFGDRYKSFPGSEEGFCHFLSSGIEGWAEGPAVAEMVKPFLRGEAYDNFIHGERYIKTPELVKRFIAALPITADPEALCGLPAPGRRRSRPVAAGDGDLLRRPGRALRPGGPGQLRRGGTTKTSSSPLPPAARRSASTPTGRRRPTGRGRSWG